MQLDVGNEPTLRFAYVTFIYLNFEKVYTLTHNTFRDMNYYPVWIIIQSDFWSSPHRQIESGAYEPTMQDAQVGSITEIPMKWIENGDWF